MWFIKGMIFFFDNQLFCWALLKSLISAQNSEKLMRWSNLCCSWFCYDAEHAGVKPFNFKQSAFPLAIKRWKMIQCSAKIYRDTNPKVKSTVERIHTYIMGLRFSVPWPYKYILLLMLENSPYRALVHVREKEKLRICLSDKEIKQVESRGKERRKGEVT